MARSILTYTLNAMLSSQHLDCSINVSDNARVFNADDAIVGHCQGFASGFSLIRSGRDGWARAANVFLVLVRELTLTLLWGLHECVNVGHVDD